ncbi:MAG: TolC family protein [Verrucomicrobiota bacterium]|nr:TolC family protein [Verrucomicrobiota bacterium]
MSVAECLQRAAERSPRLKAGAHRTEAATLRARQADRPLNPRLETEAAKVGGTGEARGLESTEFTVSVSQEFELGSKRRHRTEAAQAETAVNRVEEEANVRTVLAETRQAALAVLAAQERVCLAEETAALARETEAVAEARERAGQATVLETERARAETAKARIACEARQADQREAVRALAFCWGETEPSFDAVTGAFGSAPPPLPPVDALVVSAATQPDRRADEARVRAYAARVGVERAERVPNAGVSIGGRRFQENRDFGFVIGVGVELPFFTRNRDGVRAAEAEAEAVRLDADAARLRTESRVRQLYARLGALSAQAVRQRETVLPLVERALERIQEANRQGKAGYLDVLEARRARVDVRGEWIDTVTEYHAVFIELAWLTGAFPETL